MRAMLLTILLLGVVGAAQPIAPCTHAKVDTTGWRTERFNDRLVFRLPAAFQRDFEVTFQHSGSRWTDGDQEFAVVGGWWNRKSFGDSLQTEGYSECVDTLAGVPFRIITGYYRYHPPFAGMYFAVAVEDAKYNRGGSLEMMTRILSGKSHNREDQRLFLAIFRTIYADSLTPWGK